MADFDEEKSERKLTTLRRKEEEESIQLVSQKYNIPYLNLSTAPLELDALKIVGEETARQGELAVFQSAGKHIKIALHNPEKEKTKEALKRLSEDNYTYDLFLVSKSSLEHAWQFYRRVPKEHTAEAGTVRVSQEKVEELQKELKDLESVKDRIKQSFHSRATEALEIILAGALATDASDIHVEPSGELARLRFRLDGALHDVSDLPLKLYKLLLSRIKLVSELKLNIHDKAQDGRFTIQTSRGEIEIRTSVLPGPEAENIVLRVLNPAAIRVSFSDLGMQPWVTAAIDVELKKPNGMILTTGPTGSGKTTTLYAFLKKIKTPEIKIITIEDPIEYHLEGIEQTQVAPERGYDFSNGLRAIVRQDPDIILVGEIRDLETAETAMHASLTGHLVFSTLHTNDAAGTIPRLIDLGVKPAIIAPAINVSMAQRLIRRVCTVCRKAILPGDPIEEKVKKELSEFPKGIPIAEKEQWQIFAESAEGCKECNFTGFKGRIGVYEMILVNEAIEKLIMQEPSEYEIKKTALEQGQITMRQDGMLKIIAGITTLNEVERVVGT